MDKAAKCFLNSIKCPICKSQLDTLDGLSPLYYKYDKMIKNFSCCKDYEHYAIYLIYWELPVRICTETLILYEGKYQYKISQYHSPNNPTIDDATEITIKEVDSEHRLLDTYMNKTFNYNKLLFDFKNSDKEKIFNRIKTILVFQ